MTKNPETTRPLSDTPRTQLKRNALRAMPVRSALYALLDESLTVNVAVAGDHPVILPMAFGRDGDTLYLHGAVANGLLRRAIDAGADVCVSTTLVDGLVLARSAFHHSMNYRSGIAFGPLRDVTDDYEKRRALDVIVDHTLPGRSGECRPASDAELRATRVVAFELDEASLKVRDGDPVDDDADLSLPHYAGVVPVATRLGIPVPATDASTTSPPASALLSAARRAPRLADASHVEAPVGVRISTDPSDVDVPRLHTWLSEQSYWAPGISRADVAASVIGAHVAVALDQENAMIAFARAVNDGVRFAWLSDVFVDPSARGRGVGRAVVRALVDHPRLAALRWVLGTRDAHEVYAPIGFGPPPEGVMMQRAPR